jgi:hypothetical protein
MKETNHLELRRITENSHANSLTPDNGDIARLHSILKINRDLPTRYVLKLEQSTGAENREKEEEV